MTVVPILRHSGEDCACSVAPNTEIARIRIVALRHTGRDHCILLTRKRPAEKRWNEKNFSRLLDRPRSCMHLRC
jgi:hypothetical protein